MTFYLEGRVRRPVPRPLEIESMDFAGAPLGPPYSIFEGRPYEDDEREFLGAIDRFRCRHHRQPELTEALRIALDLGWRYQKEDN